MNRFLVKLVEQMDNFRLGEALKLSDELHKAESDGYEISKREDKYWLELTLMIEQAREKL